MWLLSTDRAELHYFPDPEDVPEGYAILSHVWGANEQTFQETQALSKQCREDGTNPRDRASEKVRRCCIVAESHGYKWIWNDTCCINKESSSELSEAINSMCRYYSLAEFCYAYLADVPTDFSLTVFRRSKWHTRGWTLQELIAPPFLAFLSSEWKVLGTKAEFADLLQDAAGVPASALKKEKELDEYSVAQRMSWAAHRETTRVEDLSYCLMGIFSINMPTLYGEGERAFQRLQEEIMKNSIDTSLLAWGNCAERSLLDAWQRCSGIAYNPPDRDNKPFYLFARSPRDFEGCNRIRFCPPIAVVHGAVIFECPFS